MAQKLLMLLLAFSLFGCTLTLNPLILEENLVYDQRLEGDWKSKDSLWRIRAYGIEDGNYFLDTKTTDQPNGKFQAKLGEVNGVRFLEIYPERPIEVHQKSLFGGHFISLYSFWRVSLDDKTLSLIPLSTEWMESQINAKNIEIDYEMSPEGFPFITASSKDLQAFVSKYANEPSAFSEAQGLKFSRQVNK